MARPVKDGLDYFPKDTNFYRNRKIRAMIGRFGADGAVLYDYILCEVYGDKGFYTLTDDSFRDIAAADLGMSPEKIGLILDYLLNQSMLLDGTLFKSVKVLTSHGIQTRYQEAVRQRALKRGICVDGKLWLLNEAETEGFIQVRQDDNYSRNNPSKSEKNHCFSAEQSAKKSKVNKSKVNKSKEKQRKVNSPPAPSRGEKQPTKIPTYEEVLMEATMRGIPDLARPFFDYYSAADWRDRDGVPVYSWRQKLVSWKVREDDRLRKQVAAQKKPQSGGKSFTDLAAEMEGKV